MNGTADRTDTPGRRRSPGVFERAWMQIVLVTVAWICAGLVGAGRMEISGPDEPRYADACRSMLESGDWIVPRYNGRPRLVKPILIYWLISLSSLASGGEATPMSARLPAAASGLVLALSTLWIGRRLFGPRVGLMAAVVLCATPLYAQMSRIALADMTLSACIAAAMAGVVEARSAGVNMRRRIFGLAVFYLCLGLGCLAKGPFIGTLLPLGVAAAWRAAETGARGLRRDTEWTWGLPLCAAVGSSWYIAAGAAGYWNEVADFILHQNLDRVLRPFDHQEAGHYYLKTFPMLFAPWILFVPAVAREIAIEGKLQWGRLPAAAAAFAVAFLAASIAAGAPSRGHPPGPMYGLATLSLCLSAAAALLWLRPVWRNPCFLPLVWFAATFLALTAAGSKRGFYLLPLFPPAALLTAWALVRLDDRLHAAAFSSTGTTAKAPGGNIDWRNAGAAGPLGSAEGNCGTEGEGWGREGEIGPDRAAPERAAANNGVRRLRPDGWDARLSEWPLMALAGLVCATPFLAFVFRESLGSPEERHMFLGFLPVYAAIAGIGAVGTAFCALKKAPAPGTYATAAAMIAGICWTYAAVAPSLDSLRGTAAFCGKVKQAVGERRLFAFAYPREAEIVWYLRKTVSDPVREAGIGDEMRRIKRMAPADRAAKRSSVAGLRRKALSAAGRNGPWAVIMTAKEYAEIFPEAKMPESWRLLARLEYRGESVYIVGSDGDRPLDAAPTSGGQGVGRT